MDVQPNQIIDMSLTAAGLLTAAGFCTVVYSMLASKRPIAKPARPVIQPRPTIAVAEPRVSTPVAVKANVEFIGLTPSHMQNPAGAISTTTQTEIRTRRNRADIIRQARQMIERGASNNEIGQSLRMTEGEIALLRQDNSRQPAGAMS